VVPFCFVRRPSGETAPQALTEIATVEKTGNPRTQSLHSR
jgi:hypothetical protein